MGIAREAIVPAWNKVSWAVVFAIIVGLAGLSTATPALAAEPSGVWLSQSKETKVRFARCGSSICGTIVWTKSGGTDSNNPNASKRNRPLQGLRMIWGMQASGKGYKGKLYNYTNGKTYSGKLEMVGSNRLKLSGCVAGGMICRSQTWTRSN